MKLEEHFAEIEKITDRMEQTDVTLEESFRLYQKGLEEIKEAGRLLDTMEKQMLVLNEEGQLEEF